VGVFQAEAFEENFRIAVGPVVSIAIGIIEQVRRLADEHAIISDCDCGSEVETFDEGGDLIGAAVVIGIFEDFDAIRATGSLRRGLGHAVVLGAEVLVDRDWLESGGIRVLEVLDDPEAAPGIERGGDGLADVGFGSEDVGFQVWGQNYAGQCGFGREVLGGRVRGSDE
jgi:hypothetical protein